MNPSTPWQATNAWSPCYVECNSGFAWGGNSCTHRYESCTASNVWDIFEATTTYPWCDTPDIIICRGLRVWTTIAACNIWATVASTNRTVSTWLYFQFGRDKWFAYPETGGKQQLYMEVYD